MKGVPLVTGMLSGKLGGLVASHNRGGQYFRQRIIPTNPNTMRQNTARTYCASAVSAWTNELASLDRTLWNEWASQVPQTDVLGQTLFLSGQQAFIKSYTSMAYAGLTPVTVPPLVMDNGPPPVTISDGTTSPSLAFSGANLASTATLMSAAPVDGRMLLYLSAPINQSVNFYRGPYQLATMEAFVATAATVVFNNTLVSMTQQNPIADGQRRAMRLVNVYNDGRVSPSLFAIGPIIDNSP